jgi:hypothetical protein
MKKVLALLAIAGFVACNNGETKEEKKDSTPVAAPVDTTVKAPDTTVAPTDTTKK